MLIITPTYSVEVKNKIAGPLLDKVNSKPLVKADPWGKCRWARTNKNIGAKMGEIVKEDPVEKRSRNNEFTLKTYRFPFQKMMPK